MEQIIINYKEYNFYEIISDICALLNSNSGIICICESPNNSKHIDIENRLKELLNSSFSTIKIDNSYIQRKYIILTEYVFIKNEQHNEEAITQIEVLPLKKTGKMIVYDYDEYLYYFYNGKKIKILIDSYFNSPFIHQILKDGIKPLIPIIYHYLKVVPIH